MRIETALLCIGLTLWASVFAPAAYHTFTAELARPCGAC